VANHLTPDELAEELQMEQQEVIGKCVQMGIPILHGRIDRVLFEASLKNPAVPPGQRRASMA
jgi:predicted nuclease with TOPRIM domain